MASPRHGTNFGITSIESLEEEVQQIVVLTTRI